jgi:hypothetical protein
MVRRIAFKMFSAVARELGRDEAAELFENFGKRRRGRPRGRSSARRQERVNELVEIYRSNAQAQEDRATLPSLPRRIAENLDESCPGAYGLSANAIEQTLRREIKKRDPKAARRSS